MNTKHPIFGSGALSLPTNVSRPLKRFHQDQEHSHGTESEPPAHKKKMDKAPVSWTSNIPEHPYAIFDPTPGVLYNLALDCLDLLKSVLRKYGAASTSTSNPGNFSLTAETKLSVNATLSLKHEECRLQEWTEILRSWNCVLAKTDKEATSTVVIARTLFEVVVQLYSMSPAVKHQEDHTEALFWLRWIAVCKFCGFEPHTVHPGRSFDDIIDELSDLNDCLFSFKTAVGLQKEGGEPNIRPTTMSSEKMEHSSSSRSPTSPAPKIKDTTATFGSLLAPQSEPPLANRSTPPKIHEEKSIVRRSPAKERKDRFHKSDTTKHHETTGAGKLTSVTTTWPERMSVKSIFVGDGATGKTSLLSWYTRGYFPETYVPTIFENYVIDSSVQPTPASKNTLITHSIFDTAGQEDYDTLRPLSYPQADVAVICFTIDRPESLMSVFEKWKPEVEKFIPDSPIILAGLKSDLRDILYAEPEQKPVSYEDGFQMADKIGAVAYMESSARNGVGVQETIFATILHGGEHVANRSSKRSRYKCIVM